MTYKKANRPDTDIKMRCLFILSHMPIYSAFTEGLPWGGTNRAWATQGYGSPISRWLIQQREQSHMAIKRLGTLYSKTRRSSAPHPPTAHAKGLKSGQGTTYLGTKDTVTEVHQKRRVRLRKLRYLPKTAYILRQGEATVTIVYTRRWECKARIFSSRWLKC